MTWWIIISTSAVACRVLTAWDVDSFAVYCRSVALFNRAIAEVEAEGASTERKYQGAVPSPAFRVMIAMGKTMTALGSKFGLSPTDRATLHVEHTGPKSGAERFIT
jgi:P27 family predicted phage terminase small subunit